MQLKSIVCGLFLMLAMLGQAQDAKTKKVVIIKKINDNGVVTENRQEAEGKDADILLKEMEENEGIDIEEIIQDGKKIIRVEKNVENRSMKPSRTEKNIDVEVTTEMKDGKATEKYKIIKIEDGVEKVFEWDGTGEMPEEMAGEFKNINIMKSSDGKNMQIMVETEDDNDSDDSRDIVIHRRADKAPRQMEWNTEGGEKIFMDRGRNREFNFNTEATNPNKATLGIMIEDTDNGVIITDIVKGSAAEAAGLRRGDVVLKLNNKYIFTSNGLIDALNPYNPNDKVKIKYIREGKEKSISATLKVKG